MGSHRTGNATGWYSDRAADWCGSELGQPSIVVVSFGRAGSDRSDSRLEFPQVDCSKYLTVSS